MKKNYRKPLMKLHDVKVRTAMMEPSVGYDDNKEGETDAMVKGMNDNNWDEF